MQKKNEEKVGVEEKTTGKLFKDNSAHVKPRSFTLECLTEDDIETEIVESICNILRKEHGFVSVAVPESPPNFN